MTIKSLSLQEVEFVAHELAIQLMDSDSEPIPPFHTRYPGKLESSISEPFQTFGGKALHRTFDERAAVLFYLITKNHCFENGNKRMAVTITLVFFFKNKHWLDASAEELYEVARSVAESNPKDRDIVHRALVNTFREYRIPLRKDV